MSWIINVLEILRFLPSLEVFLWQLCNHYVLVWIELYLLLIYKTPSLVEQSHEHCRSKALKVCKMCTFANKHKNKLQDLLSLQAEDGKALFGHVVYSSASTGLFQLIFIVGRFVAFLKSAFRVMISVTSFIVSRNVSTVCSFTFVLFLFSLACG